MLNIRKAFNKKTVKFIRPVSTATIQNTDVFKNNSTYDLIKKSIIYKASKSDFLLSKGDRLVNTSYKIFGNRITDALIENTAGQVFTSGPTIQTLIQDAEKLYTEYGLLSAGNYVLEGIEEDNAIIFDGAKDYLVETLDKYSKGRPYCHLAIKLTGLGHMQMFRDYDKAQKMLLEDLFDKYSSESTLGEWRVISRDDIKNFLNDKKIEYTEAELDEFFSIAKFEDSEYPSHQIGEVEFFQNVHTLYVFSDKHNTNLIQKINKMTLSDEMIKSIQTMQNRVLEIVEKAYIQGTQLYVDAEQTYIQSALDSFTRQLQTKYHKDNKGFILNGFQSYLKSSPRRVRLEIERCRAADISMGIKLVRGAYMLEERQLAQENQYESPIWDTIKDTHQSYDRNIATVLDSFNPERDSVLVASHNKDSCEKAKGIMEQKGLPVNNVVFGQLKGFSDTLTLSLAQEGFSVLKYLPYGPMEHLIPYLIRRGNESKQVMREHLFVDEIKQEIRARFKPG